MYQIINRVNILKYTSQLTHSHILLQSSRTPTVAQGDSGNDHTVFKTHCHLTLV